MGIYVLVLAGAFLGMYTWAHRLWLGAIHHDWSVISTGGVNMFIWMTSHRSIFAPVFQSSHQIANACGLEKCVFCQGGMDPGEGGLAAQTCWFYRLFTHFQWLIPSSGEPGHFHNLVSLTLPITPLTSSPQPYVSFHLPVLGGSTSSLQALLWFDCVCKECCVFVTSPVPLWGPLGVWVRVTEAAAAAAAEMSFMRIWTPNFHLPRIYVIANLSDRLGVREKEEDTVIPPLWLRTSHCKAGWSAALLIHLASLWTYLSWTDVIEGISERVGRPHRHTLPLSSKHQM